MSEDSTASGSGTSSKFEEIKPGKLAVGPAQPERASDAHFDSQVAGVAENTLAVLTRERGLLVGFDIPSLRQARPFQIEAWSAASDR